MTKEVIILVGGNGAGKSTFYESYLSKRQIPFLNADVYAAKRWPDAPEAHSYEAAKVIEQERDLHLNLGLSFCFETVFSHPSKVDFIAKARAKGFNVHLIVIHIASEPEVNMARVADRKRRGGHGVPEDKVAARIPRTLAHIQLALDLCTSVSFYDNTLISDPFSPQGVYANGSFRPHPACHQPKNWVNQILAR